MTKERVSLAQVLKENPQEIEKTIDLLVETFMINKVKFSVSLLAMSKMIAIIFLESKVDPAYVKIFHEDISNSYAMKFKETE